MCNRRRARCQHARHRSRGSRPHRYQQRLTDVVEALPVALSRNSMPSSGRRAGGARHAHPRR
jgi:hypothetical protein